MAGMALGMIAGQDGGLGGYLGLSCEANPRYEHQGYRTRVQNNLSRPHVPSPCAPNVRFLVHFNISGSELRSLRMWI